MLTHHQAKTFYDRFGSRQDKQFYESKPVRKLIEQGDFHNAGYVVEFGCGTGKLAADLLAHVLPDKCGYLGVDISDTMIALCREKLAEFAPRARCMKSDGSPVVPVEAQSADRYLSTYVLDLLGDADIEILLGNAHEVLSTGGYLCLAGLGHGVTLTSRTVSALWKMVFRLNPSIVGGCRPSSMAARLKPENWLVVYCEILVSYGIASEILVAKKI